MSRREIDHAAYQGSQYAHAYAREPKQNVVARDHYKRMSFCHLTNLFNLLNKSR